VVHGDLLPEINIVDPTIAGPGAATHPRIRGPITSAPAGGTGPAPTHGPGLGVTLLIRLPHVAPGTAKELALAAHQVCPYSRATRGNISVELEFAD
jgi:organic hydroperoxide reductase OsmC/OhrA